MPKIGQAYIDGLIDRKDKVKESIDMWFDSAALDEVELMLLMSHVNSLVGYISAIDDLKGDNATTQKEV